METDLPLFLDILFQIIHFQSFTIGIVMSVVIVVALLFISAAVSGSEVAYFSLSPADISKIKKLNNRKFNLALKHLENPEKLLATIVITNNFVNIGVIILSVYIFNGLIDFSNAPPYLKFLIEIVFITAMLLFFGEIVPKVYAVQNPRRIAGFMAYPLLVMNFIFNPIVKLLVKSSGIVNKQFAKRLKDNLSIDVISQALDLASADLDEEKGLLKGIVSFGNINVDAIMTGRVDMVDIDIKSKFSKVISVMVESGYSRIPVYENSPDNVKGILYVKDLLPYIGNDNTFEWHTLIRPAFYVPENKRINDLLQEFKTNKIHLAIVVDEYGGTSGIVTLEDILEEIVGDIIDELDDDETTYTKLPDGSYIFEGKTLLKDFFRITGIEEEKFNEITGDAETLAGLLLEVKGQIPFKNEVIKIIDHAFTILTVDERRIKKIKVNTMK